MEIRGKNGRKVIIKDDTSVSFITNENLIKTYRDIDELYDDVLKMNKPINGLEESFIYNEKGSSLNVHPDGRIEVYDGEHGCGTIFPTLRELLDRLYYSEEIGDENALESLNHPEYYVAGRSYEPVKVIMDWDLNFNLGNVIKYISRAGRKDGNSVIQDLKKALDYLKFELDRLSHEKHRL